MRPQTRNLLKSSHVPFAPFTTASLRPTSDWPLLLNIRRISHFPLFVGMHLQARVSASVRGSEGFWLREIKQSIVLSNWHYPCIVVRKWISPVRPVRIEHRENTYGMVNCALRAVSLLVHGGAWQWWTFGGLDLSLFAESFLCGQGFLDSFLFLWAWPLTLDSSRPHKTFVWT